MVSMWVTFTSFLQIYLFMYRPSRVWGHVRNKDACVNTRREHITA